MLMVMTKRNVLINIPFCYFHFRHEESQEKTVKKVGPLGLVRISIHVK